MPALAVGIAAAALSALAVAGPVPRLEPGGPAWWAVTLLLHLPFAGILVYLAGGVVERIGYFARGRAPRRPGRMPSTPPTVCVQLPMFNEHHVAARAIAAAAALDWPADRLEIQVLDDSTDADTRALVDAAVAEARSRGIHCTVLRRENRVGYKAGALEAGRRATSAEFLALFDADFVPPADFLRRTVPHFFDRDGAPDEPLALVQAQWGHLNAGESALTRAQSLWVDDHHTLQMSWRAAQWGFVNFTGTAGVWRASAIEHVGGWRSASLVEDCELSVRHLLAGYRTTFVRDVVAPAELPATCTAYQAQQKRWTQGWVQLQRIHLGSVLRFRAPLLRKAHLLYHLTISWQWMLWGIWLVVLPLLIHTGLWFGGLAGVAGLLLYVAPPTLWLAFSTIAATLETPSGARTTSAVLSGIARVVPYAILTTGMLPHQAMAFLEGLRGELDTEFERTPKAASVVDASASPVRISIGRRAEGVRPARVRRERVKVHRPAVIAQVAFAAYQVAWMVVFAASGLLWCALAAAGVALCVLTVLAFTGDAADRMFVVLPRPVRA